jgi:hypothetical protein
MMRGLWMLGLLACAGEPEDTAQPEPGLRILSPEDGDWYDLGDEVLLEAEAWNGDGSEADLSTMSWTVDTWSGEGNSLATTELPAGTLLIEASAQVDGQAVSDSVEISVWAR